MVEHHHPQVPNPGANDRISLGVYHGVVARLHVDQVLERVMHMPRATAVNDDFKPPKDGVRRAPRNPSRYVASLEFGNSKARAPQCESHLSGRSWRRARPYGDRRYAVGEDAGTGDSGGSTMRLGSRQRGHVRVSSTKGPSVDKRDGDGQQKGSCHVWCNSQSSSGPPRDETHRPNDCALPSKDPHDHSNSSEEDPRGGVPED